MRRFLISLGLSLALFSPAHAVWDVTTPPGTESKSLGDDRIREFKQDVQTALENEGTFPGGDTTNPRYTWKPSTGTTTDRDDLTGDDRPLGKIFINKSSAAVEQWNGTSWDRIASYIPEGAQMLFVGSSCPDGFTIDTSSAGYVIRTATDSTGGQVGGTSDVSTTTYAHTHTANDHVHDMAHTHTIPAHQHVLDYSSGSGATIGGEVTSSNSDGADLGTSASAAGTSRLIKNETKVDGGGGTTSTDSRGNTGGSSDLGMTTATGPILKYMNVLICTKD